MNNPHKYDPGLYTIRFFNQLGRKVGEHYTNTFTEAEDLGRAFGSLQYQSSYIITRTLTNSQQRPAFWMPVPPSAAALLAITTLGLGGCAVPENVHVLSSHLTISCGNGATAPVSSCEPAAPVERSK